MTFGEITSTILFEKENYGKLHQVLHLLHDFYASVTGISASQTTDDNVFLSTGKAISPGQAAYCLLDIQRTAVFTRGIYKAILKLKAEVNGPINILYAGSGPYATLLTPLTTQFSPQDVRFYMMDINQASLTSVEKLYLHLNAGNYIEELICADAATYQLTTPMHLVICEAMQRALIREPQVAIMQNILRQLNHQSIFIPEEITVRLQLVNRDLELRTKLEGGIDPERIELGSVYVINRDEYCDQPPVVLQMPGSAVGHDEVELSTEVKVFEDEVLKADSCSLTIPLPVGNIGALLGKRVRFEYEISGEPGFRWRVMENSLENWAG